MTLYSMLRITYHQHEDEMNSMTFSFFDRATCTIKQLICPADHDNGWVPHGRFEHYKIRVLIDGASEQKNNRYRSLGTFWRRRC